MAPLVARLVGERLEDGGWNCERANGSVRSSFDTTINVLEGLAEHERATGGTPESVAARHGGEEFLLARGLVRRRSTGEPADPSYLALTYPRRWHHDVLRGLEHFRDVGLRTGAAPDSRLGDAVRHVRSRRRDDGTWALDRVHAGRTWFALHDGEDVADTVSGGLGPSRMLTLRALRVLRWWDRAA